MNEAGKNVLLFSSHLIPVTASLSPLERMMLEEVLNLLVMFLTPFGSFSFWTLSSHTCQRINPFRIVAQHHCSFCKICLA